MILEKNAIFFCLKWHVYGDNPYPVPAEPPSPEGKALCFLLVSHNMLTVSMKMRLWKMRCLLPMEKGDRGAVDKGYLGMKENGERRK